MDFTEKKLKLESLELALEDLDRIIQTMKDNNYPEEKIRSFTSQRFQVWNEIYKVKKS